MSLAELWELFPIALAAHDPQWREWAHEEIRLLRGLLNDYLPVINHIGSTAIPGICAKPIVDILVEVDAASDWQGLKVRLESAGYICMSEAPPRLSFNKGYTPHGYADRVFHVHVRKYGDNEEIRFRDYLLSHPDAAKDYESLKLSLLPLYRNDRDGYTRAKTPFISRIGRLMSDGR